MTDCNKTTTVGDLPTCDNVSNDTSYLIVQKPEGACKVRISDLILGVENVDFYPELLRILNKLDEIMSVVQPNSGKWNSTYQKVLTGEPVWNQAGEYNLQQLSDTVTQNQDKWNDVSTTMQLNSANWQSTFDRVVLNADNWDSAHQNVVIYEENYLSLQQTYFGGVDLISVYTTVNTYSASW